MFSTARLTTKIKPKLLLVESSGGERPAVWRPGGVLVLLQQRAENTGQNKVPFLLLWSEDQSVFCFFFSLPDDGRTTESFRRGNVLPSRTNLKASLEGDCKASRGANRKINK